MKKLIAALLSICLFVSLSVSAFALDINESSTLKNGDTTITFDVAPSYTVTIPETVTLNKNTVGETVTYESYLTVSANDVRLTQNSAIVVSFESDYTMDVTDASAVNPYQLSYKAYVDGHELTVGSNNIATFNTGAAEQSKTIHIKADNPTYAGKYSDTVTFTVAVVK